VIRIQIRKVKNFGARERIIPSNITRDSV